MLKQIYFVITRRCNLFCDHCIRSSGPQIIDNLSLQDFSKTLSPLKSISSDDCNFLITGGEPAIHKDFSAIINQVYNYFNFVVINTNGMYQAKLIDVALKYSNLRFQISIDGDKECHENIRGKKTFDRTLETADKLSKLGNKVTIATTANLSNIASLEKLDLELKDIKYFNWTIKYEVAYGRADTSNKIPLDNWNSFVDIVCSKFLNKNRIKIDKIFPSYVFNSNNTINKNSDTLNCGTFSSKLYLNPDLTVFPCACLEEICLGDLNSDNIEIIKTSMDKYKLQMELKNNSICNFCPSKTLCNGGCPGATFHSFGHFGLGDPRCPAVQKSLL